jgi:hypothetical protein
MSAKFDLTYSEPILLNIFKHHTEFISYYIDQKSGGNDSYENIADELKYIGNSLTDLYYGPLSPLEISGEIIELLKSEKSLTINRYKKFLAVEGSNYRIIELSDTSKWVLRLGLDSQRFVHIHPGKHTPYTTRVRALTLKSAILFCIYIKRENKYIYDLSILNYVRTEYLKASPQKKLSWDYGVGRTISLLLSSY